MMMEVVWGATYSTPRGGADENTTENDSVDSEILSSRRSTLTHISVGEEGSNTSRNESATKSEPSVIITSVGTIHTRMYAY